MSEMNAIEWIVVACVYFLPILIVYKVLKNFRLNKLMVSEQNKILKDINKNLTLIIRMLNEEKKR